MYKLLCQGIDLMPYQNNIAWATDSDTIGTQISFDCMKDLFEGAVVSMWTNDTTEYFRGVIIKKTQKRWTYSYICQDYGFYLKNNEVIKQFNGLAADDAIKSLLGEAYIQGDICSIPTKIKKIYKKDLSGIIDDILDQATKDQGVKYFKELNANILTVRKLSDMIITPQIILPKTIDIDSSIEDMKNRIIITSSGEKDAKIYATAEDTTKQDWYGVLSEVQTIDDKNVAQAQNIADNLLAEKNKIFKSTSFDVMAVQDAETIRANRLIYLHAGSRLDGYYKIKSARHTMSKGNHKVNISLEW